jgi:1-deoxy-D-xylulose-5-phosphate reductoisomerase
LAWQVLDGAEGSPAVLNAANEVAVEEFLARRIRFDQIHVVNAETLQRVVHTTPATLDDLVQLDQQARSVAQALARGLSR